MPAVRAEQDIGVGRTTLRIWGYDRTAICVGQGNKRAVDHGAEG